jgi:peptidoglycan/LPS O-acetylase OafA/YrhL
MTGTKNVWAVRIGAIVVAMIVNIVVLLIADAGGANLRATGYGSDDVQTIEWPDVIFASIVDGAIGLIVFLLVLRFSPDPAKWWPIAGVIGLLVSFIPVFATGEGTGTLVTLSIMHIVAGAIIIPAFQATIGERSRTP